MKKCCEGPSKVVDVAGTVMRRLRPVTMALEGLAEEACSNLGLTELEVLDRVVGSFVESRRR